VSAIELANGVAASQRPRSTSLGCVATSQRSSGSPQLRALPRANRTEVRIHFAPPSSQLGTIAISYDPLNRARTTGRGWYNGRPI